MMLNSQDDIANHLHIRTSIVHPHLRQTGPDQIPNRPAEVPPPTSSERTATGRSPLVDLNLSARTRLIASTQGYRMLGIISPIYNEPGCATDACHIHPEGKKILGALDVVVSLADTDRELALAKEGMIGLAGLVFVLTSSILGFLLLVFVNRPVQN
jgi:histidine kinase